MRNGRPEMEEQISALYQMEEVVPNLYPAATDGGTTTVDGNASADTWGDWTTILPAATIDADPTITYFDVTAIGLYGLTSNSLMYFELQYNSVTIGRGYLYNAGTGKNAVRGEAFKMICQKKVTGQDLNMRIMSDQGSESIEVGPIAWCEGVP